jgi:hypothetical protein
MSSNEFEIQIPINLFKRKSLITDVSMMRWWKASYAKKDNTW